MNTFLLNIADFEIHLEAAGNTTILLEEGYRYFCNNTASNPADLHITAHEGLPDISGIEKKEIYTAQQENKPFWTIYACKQEYLFIIYNQEKSREIQQIAFVDKEYKNWRIYSAIIETENAICPLKHPMGPLIMYYLTVNHDAIMIHASGVFDGEKGRVFSGFSGVGKSTMADIWQKSGAELINDDRLIVRKINEQFYIYNTPMFYVDKPKKAPLHHVYLPFHAPENNLKPLSGSKAISRLMAYCIHHPYSAAFTNKHIDFLIQVAGKLKIAELGFKPDTAVIDFIKTHEQ